MNVLFPKLAPLRSSFGWQKGSDFPPGISVSAFTRLFRLRFLSTFAGNTQPLLLRATEVVKNTWIFKPPQPRFLEVHVKPQAQALDIVIFLRGERHVEIHLKHRPQ